MALGEVLQSIPERRLRQLEVRSGIDRTRLVALSAGAPPSAGELLSIAGALKLHPASLLGNATVATANEFLFRAVAPETSNDEVALRRMAERLSAVAELCGGSRSDAWLASFLPGYTESGQEAIQNAAMFRTRYAEDPFGPLSHLPQICTDRLGLVLFTMDDLPFDGASAVFNGVPVVFLARRFPPRMLFSLAHEIGHLVGHHYDSNARSTRDFISIDRQVRVTVSRRRRSEQYAHAFASELLMPSQGIGLFFRVLRDRQSARAQGVGDLEILILSRYYNVSFAVAAMRCEQLQLIPEGAAHEFVAHIKYTDRSAEKRAERLNLPPRSPITFPSISPFLVELAAKKVASGEMSLGYASELLGLSIGQLIELHAGGQYQSDM